MPLPVLVDRGLVPVPDLCAAPARRRPDRVALPVGQEPPRAVREQEVEVPDRRPALGPDSWQEAVEAPLRVRLPAAVLPEALPAARDRGYSAREVVREQLVQVDDARVRVERAEPALERVA